jgi:hypothetical protein
VKYFGYLTTDFVCDCPPAAGVDATSRLHITSHDAALTLASDSAELLRDLLCDWFGPPAGYVKGGAL